MRLASNIIKQGFQWVAPGGRLGKFQILLYHRVLANPDPLRPWEVCAQTFRQHMQILQRYYTVLSLSDALERLRRKTLPPQAVVITFDDGYEDNVSVALPILQQFGFHATFFIATGFLNGQIMFNDAVIESIRQVQSPYLDLTRLDLGQYALLSNEDKNKAIISIIKKIKHLSQSNRQRLVEAITHQTQGTLPQLMMTSEGVKALHRAGMMIGAHTVTHPILTTLTPQQARQEIADSKVQLESMIGQELRYFAYPNGYPQRDYQAEHRNMVKALGFEAACATWWGSVNHAHDYFQLPRFTPWDKSALKFILRMAQYRQKTKGQPLIANNIPVS